MRKNLVAAFALAGLMALSLCACDGSAGTGDDFAKAGNQRTTIAEQETYTGLSSAESVYAMGAVTTAGFFASDRSAAASLSVRTLSSADQASEGQSAAKEEAEDFNKYLNMIESFLDEEQLKTVVEQNTDSAYSDYDIKLTVVGKDINGEDVLHILYYTETFTREEKNESESEYEISGIMVTKEGNYALKGERSVKTQNKGEDAEREEEFRIRAYPDSSGRNTYVEMKQELSVEGDVAEQRYVYSVVKNGSVTESTAIRFELQTKDDRTEIDYRIEFLSGRAKGEYRLKKEIKDGGTQMRVKYSVDGDSGYFTIEETADGEYVYTFSDGTVKRFQS